MLNDIETLQATLEITLQATLEITLQACKTVKHVTHCSTRFRFSNALYTSRAAGGPFNLRPSRTIFSIRAIAYKMIIELAFMRCTNIGSQVIYSRNI
jgi:hypothetical protein